MDLRADWQGEVASAMDEHDIIGARAIVLYLCRSGLRWYRRDERPRAWQLTYEAVRDGFRICQAEEELTGTLPSRGEAGGIVDGKGRDRYILLAPPGDRPVVCLLGARWDLSAQPINMSLYLHLFGQSQARCVSTWHRGYRLELPHRHGIHDYTHVQPVRAVGWPQRAAVPFADQSVPDNFPAFPLRGSNMTTLCAVLAIALSADANDRQRLMHELRGSRMQRDVRSLLD